MHMYKHTYTCIHTQLYTYICTSIHIPIHITFQFEINYIKKESWTGNACLIKMLFILLNKYFLFLCLRVLWTCTYLNVLRKSAVWVVFLMFHRTDKRIQNHSNYIRYKLFDSLQWFHDDQFQFLIYGMST